MWQLRGPPEPGSAAHKVMAASGSCSHCNRDAALTVLVTTALSALLMSRSARIHCGGPQRGWMQLEVKGIPDGSELGRDLGSNSAQVSKRRPWRVHSGDAEHG